MLRKRLFALLLAAVMTPASPVSAQDEREVRFAVNYVYAAQLGFGGYSIGGLNVHLYSLPLAFELQDVVGNWDLSVGIPIQYGNYDFSEGVTELRVRGKSHTLATEPKLKLKIPVVPERWRLSLIGGFGFGGTFSSSASIIGASGRRESLEVDETYFYTYQIGISSLVQHRVRKWTFSLGNSFIYAGNDSLDTNPTVEGYGELSAGVEARHPLGFEVWNVVPDLGVFFIYDYFTPDLKFTRVDRNDLEVQNLFEVGATIGSESPIDVPLLRDLRIGGGYQFGSDLNAVRLSFGFPF